MKIENQQSRSNKVEGVEEGARGQKWNSRSMREWLKSGSGGNEGGEKNERNDEWKKDEEEF